MSLVSEWARVNLSSLHSSTFFLSACPLPLCLLSSLSACLLPSLCLPLLPVIQWSLPVMWFLWWHIPCTSSCCWSYWDHTCCQSFPPAPDWPGSCAPSSLVGTIDPLCFQRTASPSQSVLHPNKVAVKIVFIRLGRAWEWGYITCRMATSVHYHFYTYLAHPFFAFC